VTHVVFHRSVLPLVLAFLATACAAPLPTASPTPTAAGSGTAARFSVELIGTTPVIAQGSLGGKNAALPAAFLFADGIYHAFLVGFGQARGDQAVFHATSPDGVTWSVDDADPLADLGLALEAPGPIPTSVLALPDGSWLMYLWGVTDPSGRRSRIWRATAPAASGPWAAAPEPVLAGDSDKWDSLGVDSPSVVRTQSGYLMAFVGAALADSNRPQIGLATSADGITWSKRADPIISPGHCGDFDDRAVTQPRLLVTETGYLLAYAGNGLDQTDAAVGVSTSADVATWSCASSSAALDQPDVPGSDGIHTLALAASPDLPRLLIESLSGSGSEVWLGRLVVDGS
jgi:hypothetical protein